MNLKNLADFGLAFFDQHLMRRAARTKNSTSDAEYME
jgi:hypothetical protein